MPEFTFDQSGAVAVIAPDDNERAITFDNLDAFTQGYIEALFFTDEEGLKSEQGCEPGHPESSGFSDLAPETLASIIADCEAFQKSQSKQLRDAQDMNAPDDTQAGRDFWYTRNGHGCGFWDGDWPEPYASQLDAASKAFGNVDSYLGDDGKVYLS